MNIMNHSTLVIKLISYLVIIITLTLTECSIAGDKVLTKIISVHHIKKPRDNDGFRPESLLLEKKLSRGRRVNIGILENSEGRLGLSLGYTKDVKNYPTFDIFTKLQLVSNYKDESIPVIPIPFIGLRYHLNHKVDLVGESIYVPIRNKDYLLVVTSLSINF